MWVWDTSPRYVFECTGREIYANHCIIGINPDLDVYEGYDGYIETSEDAPLIESGDTIPLTPEERRELSDMMIALWKKFAEVKK